MESVTCNIYPPNKVAVKQLLARSCVPRRVACLYKMCNFRRRERVWQASCRCRVLRPVRPCCITFLSPSFAIADASLILFLFSHVTIPWILLIYTAYTYFVKCKLPISTDPFKSSQYWMRDSGYYVFVSIQTKFVEDQFIVRSQSYRWKFSSKRTCSQIRLVNSVIEAWASLHIIAYIL